MEIITQHFKKHTKNRSFNLTSTSGSGNYKNMKTLTQKQKAEILGLNPSHLCRIVNCVLNARGDLARKLAQATNTDLALWLVGGSGTPETRRVAIKSWADSAKQ